MSEENERNEESKCERKIDHKNCFRLPTLCLNIDEKDEIEIEAFWDEQEKKEIIEGVPLLEKLTLAADHLLRKNPLVMLINIYNKRMKEYHCNAIIIKDGNVERFDPRGYNKDTNNTDMVKNFYDPEKLDTFLKDLIISEWNIDKLCILANRIKNGTEAIPTLNYIKIQSDVKGIVSDDVNFEDHNKCDQLTFDYINIRLNNNNATESMIKWKEEKRKLESDK